MPKIAYREHRFRAESLLTIQRCNTIIADYIRQGFDLSLRQLYYQFVSRDWIQNSQKSYDNLGNLVSDARLAGRIDWHSISDRTRNLAASYASGPQDQWMKDIVQGWRHNMWDAQPQYVEVWIEKDALSGVVSRGCQRRRAPYMACKGYMSQSEMWQAGQRILRKQKAGKEVVIIHLGDHDPSGIDMTRDIADRLSMFTYDAVEVMRIALNMDQVQQYNPPPNFAKLTDVRAPAYIAEFGSSSWELDAIDPTTLAALIADTIDKFVDIPQWAKDDKYEDDVLAELQRVGTHYDEIKRWLTHYDEVHNFMLDQNWDDASTTDDEEGTDVDSDELDPELDQ